MYHLTSPKSLPNQLVLKKKFYIYNQDSNDNINIISH